MTDQDVAALLDSLSWEELRNALAWLSGYDEDKFARAIEHGREVSR
ncbi:hypothetical protein [Nonomuraea sp. bgisy101]